MRHTPNSSRARRRLGPALSAACALAAPALLAVAPPAQAAMAVIDVSAIRQLVQQVAYWREQLRAMSNQLAQLQRTHDALTGGRGMERLLPLTREARNYLPEDVVRLHELTSRPGRHAALARAIEALVDADAVLPDERLAGFSTAERATLEQTRTANARAQVLLSRAYEEQSTRFGELQRLIDALARAPDAKAVEDLQARIAAEQAMLATEHTKLFALQAVVEAERASAEERRREQVVASHGAFSTRFTPTPPGP